MPETAADRGVLPTVPGTAGSLPETRRRVDGRKVTIYAATSVLEPQAGGGTNESLVIGGDFRDCRIGIRMQMLVEVLREKHAANYQYGSQVSARADVQLAHQAAFCKLTGITP